VAPETTGINAERPRRAAIALEVGEGGGRCHTIRQPSNEMRMRIAFRREAAAMV